MARFSSYLPSKTFTWTVGSLAIVVFLIAGAYFWPRQATTTLKESLVTPTIAQVSAVIANQDTDGDGLKDWEEKLWKTDPVKSDTDGDKTSDGDEIRAGRNPLKAGPSDKLAIAPSGSILSLSDKPLTATDIIARDLFTQYAQARKAGNKLDLATEQQIISSVLSRNALSSNPPSYKKSDILLSKSSDGLGLREYGNAMGAIVKKYSIGNENEMTIFERAVNNDDPDELKQLDPIIGAYVGMLTEMTSTAVPEKALIPHLSLLNSMNAILFTIKNLRAVYEDPATALASLNAYFDYSRDLGESLKSIHDFFAGKNISFTKDEDGFYFANMAY